MLGILLKTELDSTDFKNENLTTKTGQKDHVFLKKVFHDN